MRVVLDNNIFISAVLGGRLGIIIDEWKAGKFKLVVTDAIAREYPPHCPLTKLRIGAKAQLLCS
jgi:predicted nucleic acid-binding protein